MDEAETLTWDALAPEELDAAPDALFRVDGAGRLLFANAAARALCGAAAEAIGCDLFERVLPAARQPGFYGRFCEGVRAGRLQAAFPFVFGFEPPVRARVELSEGRRPDEYWVALRAIEHLAPSRQRDAALLAESAEATVGRRSRAEPIDPTICEREPIHVPGAVQPHAAMLALDPADWRVRACSEGVGEMLGAEPGRLLGHPAAAFLPPEVMRALRLAAEAGRLATPERPWRTRARLGPERRAFLLAAHLAGARLLLELELEPQRPEDYDDAQPMDAQQAVARIRAAPSLEAAAAACADEIRAMTGFERVLVYRFDPDWNGEAVAESAVEGYPSLLGLRFPSSDIPAQARALYTRAPARFVVDRDATPTAVLVEPASGNTPVDLSFVQARALSPIHLEYQRNLGVNGSMSVSILAEGHLWGLVIGHHHRPHYVTPQGRALAALVTDAFALRLHELASVKAWNEQQAALEVQNELLARLASDDDFVAALTGADGAGGGSATLLDLVVATGAAVVSEERAATVGRTPPAPVLLALAEWLRDQMPPEQRVFSTDDLSEHWAPAGGHREAMSGLLAVFVGAKRRHLLLWVREEVAGTVVWGGDPTKPVMADAGGVTVLPRRSFERWVEERRGQAEPWASWQLLAAESLSSAIEGVVLRQGRKIAELSAKQAELTLALEQKEVLAREIDHRVKNSLQIVASIMLMQARAADDPAAKATFQDTYTRVMSVARVHDSLQHADDAETVDLGETLRLLCGDIATGLSDSADRLAVEAEEGLMAPSRVAVALSLVATELITNAFKYAYRPDERGPVEVRLSGEGGGYRLSVCDEGRGLPDDWMTRRRERGGLGMKVIRAVLTQIGAEMTVGAGRRGGACFTVSTRPVATSASEPAATSVVS